MCHCEWGNCLQWEEMLRTTRIFLMLSMWPDSKLSSSSNILITHSLSLSLCRVYTNKDWRAATVSVQARDHATLLTSDHWPSLTPLSSHPVPAAAPHTPQRMLTENIWNETLTQLVHQHHRYRREQIISSHWTRGALLSNHWSNHIMCIMIHAYTMIARKPSAALNDAIDL